MRIYFDKNIFSYLRKDEKYANLLSAIKENKNKHIYFFSKAHIDDLKNDKTNEKYLDLSFIEEIAGKNYLCKYFNQKLNTYVVTPTEVFNTDDPDPFDFNIDDLLKVPEFVEKIKVLEKTFLDTNIDNKVIDSIPKFLESPMKDYIQNTLEQTRNFNIKKLIKDNSAFLIDLQNNDEAYKKIRKFFIDNYSTLFKKKIEKLEKEQIDELFMDSFFKTRFLEYVDNNVTVETNDYDERLYYQFLMAYDILNFLGLDREKTRKIKYKNLQNDSLHTYYAGVCDIFVTNDNGIIEKGTLLYEFFDVDVQIMTIDEFQKYYTSTNSNQNDILERFQEVLVRDIRNFHIVEEYKENDMLHLKMNANNPYFGIFKYIQIIIKKEKLLSNIVLLSSSKKIIRLIIYEEIKIIVNNLIDLLGIDLENKTYFKNEEIGELINNAWNGRYWLFANGIFHLGIYPEKCLIFFDILFKEKSEADK